LVVDCKVDLQRERLGARDGFTSVEIEQIIGAQVDQKTRLAIANDVIYNNSNIDRLRERVLALHLEFSARALK